MWVSHCLPCLNPTFVCRWLTNLRNRHNTTFKVNQFPRFGKFLSIDTVVSSRKYRPYVLQSHKLLGFSMSKYVFQYILSRLHMYTCKSPPDLFSVRESTPLTSFEIKQFIRRYHFINQEILTICRRSLYCQCTTREYSTLPPRWSPIYYVICIEDLGKPSTHKLKYHFSLPDSIIYKSENTTYFLFFYRSTRISFPL